MKITIQEIVKELRFTRQYFYEYNKKYKYFKRIYYGLYEIEERTYEKIKEFFRFKAQSKLRNRHKADKRKAPRKNLR